MASSKDNARPFHYASTATSLLCTSGDCGRRSSGIVLGQFTLALSNTFCIIRNPVGGATLPTSGGSFLEYSHYGNFGLHVANQSFHTDTASHAARTRMANFYMGQEFVRSKSTGQGGSSRTSDLASGTKCQWGAGTAVVNCRGNPGSCVSPHPTLVTLYRGTLGTTYIGKNTLRACANIILYCTMFL